MPQTTQIARKLSKGFNFKGPTFTLGGGVDRWIKVEQKQVEIESQSSVFLTV